MPQIEDDTARHWRYLATQRLRAAEEARLALQNLLHASEPYIQKAAPHEHLFDAEDMRYFEELAIAADDADYVLRGYLP